jgi:hypothetical protein
MSREMYVFGLLSFVCCAVFRYNSVDTLKRTDVINFFCRDRTCPILFLLYGVVVRYVFTSGTLGRHIRLLDLCYLIAVLPYLAVERDDVAFSRGSSELSDRRLPVKLIHAHLCEDKRDFIDYWS